VPIARGLRPGLADLRVQPQIRDELASAVEAGDVPDGRDHRRRGPDVHTRDRQQPAQPGPREGDLAEIQMNIQTKEPHEKPPPFTNSLYETEGTAGSDNYGYGLGPGLVAD
jgi:hypothetical protein